MGRFALRVTCFVWEGVTNYLDERAIDRTLRDLAQLSPVGCRLIFTYVERAALDPGGGFTRLLAKSGESWTFGFHPRDVAGFLSDRGFRLLSDEAAPEYRARYPQRFSRSRRGYEWNARRGPDSFHVP